MIYDKTYLISRMGFPMIWNIVQVLWAIVAIVLNANATAAAAVCHSQCHSGAASSQNGKDSQKGPYGGLNKPFMVVPKRDPTEVKYPAIPAFI